MPNASVGGKAVSPKDFKFLEIKIGQGYSPEEAQSALGAVKESLAKGFSFAEQALPQPLRLVPKMMQGAADAGLSMFKGAIERAKRGAENFQSAFQPGIKLDERLSDIGKGTTALTGAFGQGVSALPVAGAGALSPILADSAKGYREAYGLLPEPAKKALGTLSGQIKAIGNKIPQDIRQQAGDVAWSVPGIAALGQLSVMNEPLGIDKVKGMAKSIAGNKRGEAVMPTLGGSDKIPLDIKFRFKPFGYDGNHYAGVKVLKGSKEVGNISYTIKNEADLFGKGKFYNARGYSLKDFGLKPNEKIATVWDVGIDEGLRGKGIGTKLWKKLEKKLMDEGADQLTVVEASNPGFYAKMGLKPTGGDEISRLWFKRLND